MLIDAAVVRLHQLAWQPGAVMHDGWWQRLGLAPWRAYYTQPGPLRRQIDRLIRHQRAYPTTALPATLSSEQQQLLALEPRLALLLTALGVQLLGCPDYLLRGEYRRVLAGVLGWQALSQLWALWRGGQQPLLPKLTPEALPQQACAYAIAALTQQRAQDPVWQALLIMQPPPDPPCRESNTPHSIPLQQLALPVAGDRIVELQRLARFL